MPHHQKFPSRRTLEGIGVVYNCKIKTEHIPRINLTDISTASGADCYSFDLRASSNRIDFSFSAVVEM